MGADHDPARHFVDEQGVQVIAEGVAGLIAVPVAVENEAPADDVAQRFSARPVLRGQLPLDPVVDGVRVHFLSAQRLQNGFLGGDGRPLPLVVRLVEVLLVVPRRLLSIRR